MSGAAAAGPSGQGNPYPYRELDRVVADFRLVRFNPNQLVHRHPHNPDRNITLLQCVDHLVVRHDHSYPKGTVVVDNTLNFRFAIF